MKDVNILINNGANIKKALELFGDMETYDATLETFLQEVPGKLEKIKSCKEIGDMANYAILVHSLKSDARYFGFETLGELAYDHELKSKANDMYYVSEHFKDASVVRQKKYLAAAEDLKASKVDAIVMDELPAKQIILNNTGLVILDEEITSDSYGMIVKKGNKELLLAINKVIDRLKSEGKIDEFVLNHTEE